MTAPSRFVQSAARFGQLPDHGKPEFAFCGRSNVGKSTLLGRLMGAPKLVKTSRTPGRTQLLNLFMMREELALVDMPGYGYAKLPKKMREEMDAMVQEYLRERTLLRGVVMVVDARRDPVSEYDTFVASWVLEQSRPLLVAITKSDTIPKTRRQGRQRAIESQLGVPAGAALLCSGKTGEGKRELLARLFELCGPQGATPSDG